MPESAPLTQVIPSPTPLAGDATDELAESLAQMRRQEPQSAETAARAAERMPRTGDRFLGFTLTAELGQGAFGRVFLATQNELAERPIALKVSADLSARRGMPVAGEAQKLARLQHTNIVPVYSVHRAGNLQAVAMPYLGSTTLAQVIGKLRAGAELPSSGRYVCSTLNNHRSTLNSASRPNSESDSPPSLERKPQQTPAPGPRSDVVLDMFSGMSYVNAMLWIAARIAGGLAHAHERGILHRDLKPANVLLTDDGQPMLLDFNLAEDLTNRGGSARAQLGGTLPYMAPEQLSSLGGGEGTVDERSDLYALGIILFELLTGRFPFTPARHKSTTMLEEMLAERRQAPPSPRRLNPAVSPAADAIVRKLLESDPARRYARAADLQEDLDRHLTDRSLRHAREASRREQLGKWRRRNPRLATGLLVGLAAALFLILPSAVIAARMRRSAEDRLRIESSDAQDLLARTESDYRDAHARLTTHTADRDLLESGLGSARSVFDRYGVGRDDDWSRRPAVARLSGANRGRLNEIIGELLLLAARAEYRLAEDRKPRDPAAAAARLAAAEHWSRSAQDFFGEGKPPRSLWKLRADLLRTSGNETAAAASLATFQRTPSRSDFDRYVEAADLAAAGDPRAALERVEPLTLKNPGDYAAWFVQGKCFDALGRAADAAECYSVCVALQPRSAAACFNRGLMRLRQRDYRRAEQDFARTLDLRPDDIDARINRGITRLNLQQYAAAAEDLTEALKHTNVPTRVYFLRALVRGRAGDSKGAASDQAEGMRLTPNDSLSWNTRGFHRLRSDPTGALADFEQALDLSPRSPDALLNKANVLAEGLRRPEEAVSVYDRLVELFAEDLNARGSRGVVLARLGRAEAARRDAEFCLERDRSAFVCFQMAGLYAQLWRGTKSADDRRTALQLLGSALRKGFDQLELVAADPDLEPVRDDPEFRRLADLARDLMRQAPRRP